MILELTPLENAVHSLNQALLECQKDTVNTFVRDACIFRFKFVYDLSYKMFTHFLNMIGADRFTNISCSQ